MKDKEIKAEINKFLKIIESDFIKDGNYYFSYLEGILFTYYPDGTGERNWLTRSHNIGLDHPISNFDKGYYDVIYEDAEGNEIYNTRVEFKIVLDENAVNDDTYSGVVPGSSYPGSTSSSSSNNSSSSENNVDNDSYLQLKDDYKGVVLGGNFVPGTTVTAEEINVNNSNYQPLKDKIDNRKIVKSYEITVSNTSYSGKINVTIPVGDVYNEQMVTVLHQKHNNEVEEFKAKVTNGQVMVEVDELSPFVVLLDDVVKDETPTLGIPSYLGIASLLLVSASFCLVKVLKRR